MKTTVGRLLFMAIGLRLIQTSLRLRGFQSTVRGLDWFIERTRGDVFDGTVRWVAEIDKVARPPRPPSCLDRSVFLWYLMRLNRLDPQLRVGITTGELGGDEVDAHAWVEFWGVVVNDDPDVATRYSVFEGDPAGMAFG